MTTLSNIKPAERNNKKLKEFGHIANCQYTTLVMLSSKVSTLDRCENKRQRKTGEYKSLKVQLSAEISRYYVE